MKSQRTSQKNISSGCKAPRSEGHHDRTAPHKHCWIWNHSCDHDAVRQRCGVVHSNCKAQGSSRLLKLRASREAGCRIGGTKTCNFSTVHGTTQHLVVITSLIASASSSDKSRLQQPIWSIIQTQYRAYTTACIPAADTLWLTMHSCNLP